MPYLCYDGFINREPEKPFCSGETGAGRVDNREVINDVLVNLFNEILRLEEEAIITDKYKDISNNENIRYERPTPTEILEVKQLVEENLGKPSSGNILYHLDCSQLKNYTDDEISQILIY